MQHISNDTLDWTFKTQRTSNDRNQRHLPEPKKLLLKFSTSKLNHSSQRPIQIWSQPRSYHVHIR